MGSPVERKRVLVVGGGVAGLTAARLLAERGARVTLLEREPVVGGLARSYRYGDFVFDVGPHRFHTDDAEVERFVLETLADDHQQIDRQSAVWLYGSYHDWPLTRSSVLKLPPVVMLRAFADLFARPDPIDESLESYILSRYGRTLYEVFFRPYTEKFLSLKCSELHRDWASAGVNRAVIDRRLKFDSLLDVAWTTLRAPRVRTRFIYPESGGIDRFGEALADRARRAGAQIVANAPVTGLSSRDGRVESIAALGQGSLEADLIVWTAPLTLLLERLGEARPGLSYLAEVLYNFTVCHEPLVPYQWCYYGGAALSFMRASIPSRFGRRNAPAGLSGVCVELVCTEGDEVWREPERLRRDIEVDLIRVGLLRSRDDVLDVHTERVREAYPIYSLDYPGHLARAIATVSHLSNVLLLGRTGTFWYNNMDHSIRQALDLAGRLDGGLSCRDWNQGLWKAREL